MDSLKKTVWNSRYLSRGTKIRVFRSLVMPVLLYSCETWTLTDRLKKRLNSFVTISLRRIFKYTWSDFVPNEVILRRAGMGKATCLIRERQLRFYGHLARFPPDDPTHRILSAEDPSDWVRPMWGAPVIRGCGSWTNSSRRAWAGDRLGQPLGRNLVSGDIE